MTNGVGPTVLLLDDDADLREALDHIFRTLGWRCLPLPSFAAMSDLRPAVLDCELAILDVNLGQGLPSGVDAHAWLRQHQFAGRIVFLTGHAPSHPLVARAAASGDQVLRKPMSSEELRALAKRPDRP